MKFTQTHEWVFIEKGMGIVGISNFAQKELGDIVFVELPQVGAIIEAGDEVAVLESTKAAADVYTPVSGEIIAVNTALLEYPETVNQAAEKGGWLFKVKVSNPKEADSLMDFNAYQAFIAPPNTKNDSIVD